MEFTNKANLPKHIYNLLTYDTYNKSGAKFDLSATTLIDAMQPKRLFKQHWSEVEEDCIDRIWSMLGTAVHAMLEAANANDPDIVTEKRFIHEMFGKKISAQIDVYDMVTNCISDFKCTSAWKVVASDTASWTTQMNIQAALARKSGWIVDGLYIDVLCRDFAMSKAKESGYPNIPLVTIDIPLWSEDQALTYIEERIKHHTDDVMQPCTDKERWATQEAYAIYKKGRARALRVLPTKDKALRYAAAQNLTASEFRIEHRKPVYKRCDNYCSVAKWCPQINSIAAI